LSETAEKVRGLIRRAVSPQQISLDDVAEALRRAVWTSRIGGDRLTAGGIDFLSGLVENRNLRFSSAASVSSAAHDVLVPARMQERQVFERRPARRLASSRA
jgi:hypothetical protein